LRMLTLKVMKLGVVTASMVTMTVKVINLETVKTMR
jgi:hypothetical protein